MIPLVPRKQQIDNKEKTMPDLANYYNQNE